MRNAWRSSVRRIAVCSLIFFGAARAQSPRGVETLSPSAVAESLTVLQALEHQVGLRQNDSRAWHELGILAWSLAARGKAAQAPSSLDPTRLGRMADTSLRMAAAIAATNANYHIDVGRYLLSTGVAISRTAAKVAFEKALSVARTAGSTPAHAEAALAVARAYWARYEAFAHRRLPLADATPPRSVTEAMHAMNAKAAEAKTQADQLAEVFFDLMNTKMKDITGQLVMITKPEDLDRIPNAALWAAAPDAMAPMRFGNPGSFKGARARLETESAPIDAKIMGDPDYEAAYALFDEAYHAAPSFPGAFRGIAMVYADRGRWVELERLARTHIAAFPRDSLAWMTLGVALHRMRKDAGAAAAFDTALAILPAAERRRLTAWERVSKPDRDGDAPALAGASGLARDDLYWMLANPVWAEGEDRARVEFLSRVAYAELRWTVEENDLHGADTDRGDVFVRYGPPNRIMAIGPVAQDASDIVTFWDYDSGLLFAFRGMPTFLSSHFANEDAALMRALIDLQPVRWDDLDAPAIDSVDARLTRFRSRPGFVDVVVAAALPAPDSIARSMSVRGQVQRHFWLVEPGTVQTARSDGTVDTLSHRAEFRTSAVMDTGGVYSWTQQVPPASIVYRVEEYGTTATRVARATGVLDANADAFPTLGFGMSDVLFAVGSRRVATVNQRWTDFNAVPVASRAKHGANLAFVWEVYELGQNAGRANYDVTLTIERQRSAAGRIMATIAGALESAVGVSHEPDRLTLTFSRAAPWSSTLADCIDLDLGATPEGSYTVTLSVADKATGKTAVRVSNLVIGE